MDVFTRVDAVIALADGVPAPADLPAAEMARIRKKTAEIAVSFGVPADLADEIAEEVERALTEFADALVTAARAAEKVNAVANKHSEELRKYVQAN
jgi:hypothetical protein